MRRLRLVALAVAGTAALLLSGCASSTPTGTASSTTTTPAGSPSSSSLVSTGTLTVFAAASLKSTFTTLGEQFEKAHAGVDVTFSFAGSSDLATQIQNGAPADVFASADQANMTKVVDAGLTAAAPVPFATNVLTIVTPPGNPKGVATFADLAESGTALVVCAPQVPCGAATERVEKATGVTLTPVSEESSVTDVLTKVESGEADAGLVYVTDARGAAGKVTEVTFPESSGAVNTYPIAPLSGAAQPELAKDFAAYVAGPDGRAVLQAAGFGAP
ncbi:molybdate transport system substrate-binding protein [Quadrisphaera granulorum]|uniref:Molybdate-binding protein ModA n=1 Tax=Quadrisphaera granulorum TaxID=317664 RepID=A0A315ZN67_9ACTN|nr:molybdate ABC transporter substrate-binding protein [Quadrisphaera granulorum]PWJ46308.1 molybdate transport system substrate-binding protein [Quadrisphaera granulorum]SZE99069.1 molybdate transport system substrate-binding protein [Quadrisphaera granulorum]